MKKNELRLSSLAHTWIVDLDGTLLKHNGYLIDGRDALLDGAKEFIDSIPQKDFILLVTSRGEEMRKRTVAFLKENHIRYNEIVFNLPFGERILLNDNKPSGLKTAIAVEKTRDGCEFPRFFEDETL